MSSYLQQLANVLIGFAVFMVVFWVYRWLSLIVHESGHYFAGRLVGIPIEHVRLGNGRMARAFRFGHVTVFLYRYPTCGWVMPGRHNAPPSRPRRFIFVLGGPLATAGLTSLLFWVTSETYQVRPDVHSFAYLFSFIEMGTLVMTLWPARVRIYGQLAENDGMLLWRTIFPKRITASDKHKDTLVHEAVKLAAEKRTDEAIKLGRELITLSESAREHDALQDWLARVLAEAGRVEEAATIYRQLLDSMKPNDREFGHHADSFATVVLSQNASSYFAECEALLRKALECNPGKSLKGTLAGLLAERSADSEAEPLFRDLHRHGKSEFDIGISAAYLSVIAARRGDSNASARFRKEALYLLPKDPLVLRLVQTESLSQPQVA